MYRKIINLAVGKPREFEWNNKKEISAIGKSVVQAVEVKKSGIVGDDVANHKFHGGPVTLKETTNYPASIPFTRLQKLLT